MNREGRIKGNEPPGRQGKRATGCDWVTFLQGLPAVHRFYLVGT